MNVAIHSLNRKIYIPTVYTGICDDVVKNITVGISDELSNRMDEFKEVNWSAITRVCIEQYIIQRSSNQFETAIAEVQSKKSLEFKKGFNFFLNNIKRIDLSDLEYIADFEPTDSYDQDVLLTHLIEIATEINPTLEGPINTQFLYGMRSSAKEILKRSK